MPFMYFPTFYCVKELVQGPPGGNVVVDGLSKYKENWVVDQTAMVNMAAGRRRLLLGAALAEIAFETRRQLRVDGVRVLLAGRLSYQVCYAAVGEGRVSTGIRGACSWPPSKRP